MALPLYLAMTAAEISRATVLPNNCAYMACHFSPYGTGLSNFPQELPENALLIVNDRTPVQGHDPILIAEQLVQMAEDWKVSGILLDFQRPAQTETDRIAKAILAALPCPVGICEHYARELDCPVFLPPPPPDSSLNQYISHWHGRELWLEVALDSKAILITEEGSQSPPAPADLPFFPYRDSRLHCSYHINAQPDQVLFTLRRTAEDLGDLLTEAEALGVTRAVGLFQELGKFFC